MSARPSSSSLMSAFPNSSVSHIDGSISRYEPFLATDCRFNHTGRPLASSDLVTAGDGVMTALAQLGTYQTGTERAFISLFDATYQYFVAEATPLTPLTPTLPSDDCPVPLVHCGTAIPRKHGICELALSAAVNPNPDLSRSVKKLPVTVVDDLASDTRLSSRPFCGFSDAYQFYAVVPVRTRTGIDIGTYCVLNPTKPAHWDERCMQRLSDLSAAIMEHLVVKRSKHAFRRNERVNRGLGSLIEGRATVSGWQFGPNAAAYGDHKAEGILYPQQRLERRAMENKVRAETMPVAPTETTEHFLINTSADVHDQSQEMPEIHDLGPSQSANVSRRKDSSSADEVDAEGIADSGDDDLIQIFSRAANIIRESFEVAGCLFFDITLGSSRVTANQRPLRDNDTGREVSPTSSASGSDDHSDRPPAESRDGPSDVLGFSTSDASSLGKDELPDSEKVITKRFLAKLLRRYPGGRIFSFDADGELQSSDYSDEDSRSNPPPAKPVPSQDSTEDAVEAAAAAAEADKTQGQSSRPTEITLLRKAFPAARSVAFVPIWSYKRERWLAGGFMYTLTPARVFSIEAELSLFKAFGKIITSDVHSFEARQVEKAQADTLGSLSHELRSPLHGIMFSTELLDKNDLSVFQSNATHTIETCCRTLLDTINHLLDYSKVNSFGLKKQNDSHDNFSKARRRVPKSISGKKPLHMHVRLDGLVEEVMNSMFAGFNFQYMSIRQLSKSDRSLWTDSAAHNRLDGAQAMEQLDLNAENKSTHKLHFGGVSVYMSIDPTCDWTFYLQTGAMRRILMNLFGNSLKYTDTGFICVTLKQEISVTKRGKSERMVKLVVRDTGKGIGKDYLTHNLFRPFSQEDELASGTGLGLSIVKATVLQLGGRVQVESKADVGTTVTVKLPLVQSLNVSDIIDVSEEDRAFDKSLKELKGMRVKLVGFDSQGDEGADDGRGVERDICRRWLCLDVLTDEQAEHMTPDIVLWLDDALQHSSFSPEQLAKTPNIVICKDPFVAYQRFKMQAATGQEGIFEYITQP